MHHSKDLVFTFIMMLIFIHCTVKINNFQHVIHGPLHTTGLFSYSRSMIIFESDSFKPNQHL